MHRVWIVLSALALSVPASAQSGAARSAAFPESEDVPIAMLVDISSGQILHAKNADRRFVPASITKLMTAFVAFEQIEQGTLDPDQIIPVPDATAAEWRGKGSTMFLDAGDRVPLSLLLTGIMNVSANDASIVLAEHQTGNLQDWLDAMNQAAKSLGMTNSKFGTPNGWPDEGRTFTTARDLVTLASAVITRHPQKYVAYIGREGLRYKAIAQANRDPLARRFEGADGIKTGYTNEAGFGYVGSAERDGQRLVMVVAGISRQAIRNRFAAQYLEWGFSAFEQRTLFERAELIGLARVQGGMEKEVELVARGPVQVGLPREMSSPVELSILYDGPIRAPVKSGDRVATLRVEAEGIEPALIPLVARNAVAPAGFWGRLWNGLTGWFT